MQAHVEQILKWIEEDRNDLVDFFSGFVQAKSPNPPGDTRQAAKYLQRYLESQSLSYRVIAARDDMPNLVASFDCGAEGRHLILNGHLDVFPADDADAWDHDPWSGKVTEGRVWGRGSADMKCGTAIATMTFVYLARLKHQLSGRLTLTAVSDEETGGYYGSRHLIEHYSEEVLGDCVLSAEPSSLQTIRFGEKGTLRAAITIDTPGAHGAYTHLSTSATKIAARMIMDLDDLERLTPTSPRSVTKVMRTKEVRRALERGLGEGAASVVERLTVNVGVINGGHKINMLPGTCKIEVDIRIPVGLSQRNVQRQLDEIVSRYPEASINYLDRHSYEPSWSDPAGEMLVILQENATRISQIMPKPVITLGGTDCRYWRYRNIPSYVYGVSPDNMGATNESVSIEEYLSVLKCHVVSAYEYLNQ